MYIGNRPPALPEVGGFQFRKTKMKEQSPLYATLFYEARKKLDISWSEYIYLDMVHKLSYERWCIKSLENCAKDLGLTKRGVSKMKERLISKGLLKRNIKGHLRVTLKYTGVAVNKVHQTPHVAVNKVPKSVNLVPSGGELSSTKNNNRITKNNGEGYKKARQMRDQLSKRLSLNLNQ